VDIPKGLVSSIVSISIRTRGATTSRRSPSAQRGYNRNMDKRRFIKDPVWGNVEIFEWEKEILNHYLLNRLHNVVQNSCAFRVYPGLKYSRFSHSVGVMHAATQMFVNVVINSGPHAREQLRQEQEHALGAFRATGDIGGKQIAATVSRVVPCSTEWSLLLAVVRVAALVHDIGHLPYSHVFESALESFLNFGIPGKTSNTSEDRLAALRRLLRGGEAPSTQVTNPPQSQKVHEVLGESFVSVLADDLAVSYVHGESVALSVSQAAALARAANTVLHDALMPITRSLISGILDADRIDFVRRDTLFSGLLTSSVDYGRLFSTYELIEREDSAVGMVRYLPGPSKRSSSEGEKLLFERFQDYKYITAHHKVHLFDELLERLIYHSMEDGTLDPFFKSLEALLTLLSPAQLQIISRDLKLAKLKRQLLTEFDDAWLDQMMRLGYSKQWDDDGDSLLFVPHVEARGLFTSLFKRDEEYAAFCQKHNLQLDPAHILPRVRALKYQWEKDIIQSWRSEGGTEHFMLVIGDLDEKLRDGFGQDKEAAKLLGLRELQRFLEMKIRTTTPLNAWYTHAGKTTMTGKTIDTREWVEAQLASTLKSTTIPQ